MSQGFSRKENRILGALARLDDFLTNPLLQGHSGTNPETSRNVFIINQGTNEDGSQSVLHPEAGLLTSGQEDRHDMAMGVQRERESAYGQDLDKSTRNKIFLEFSGVYNGVCLKNFQRVEQELKNAFLPKFSIFLRIS